MPPENTGAQQGDLGAGDTASEALTEARVAEIVQSVVGKVVNAAVTNHLKRQKSESEQQFGQIDKLVAEAVSKALATSGTNTSAAGATLIEGDAIKPNKELLDLREQFEKLERKNAESEARAKSVEEKARWDGARGSVRKALEAKGVAGVRADAIVALFEQSKALRFDEDGNPKLTVTRSRSKSAPIEEIEWGISEGVDDWSKSPDAAEFLPPPAPPVNRQGGYGSPQNSARKGPIHYDRPAQSLEDAARRAQDILSNQGVDISEAFRR